MQESRSGRRRSRSRGSRVARLAAEEPSAETETPNDAHETETDSEVAEAPTSTVAADAGTEAGDVAESTGVDVEAASPAETIEPAPASADQAEPEMVASRGRAANDPRKQAVDTSSEVATLDATPRTAPPVLSEDSRDADDEHPSARGRPANDPRQGSEPPKAEIVDATTTASSASEPEAEPLPEIPSDTDEGHPSHRGRAPNDPRGAGGVAAG